VELSAFRQVPKENLTSLDTKRVKIPSLVSVCDFN
jgi:hypothetical protein